MLSNRSFPSLLVENMTTNVGPKTENFASVEICPIGAALMVMVFLPNLPQFLLLFPGPFGRMNLAHDNRDDILSYFILHDSCSSPLFIYTNVINAFYSYNVANYHRNSPIFFKFYKSCLACLLFDLTQ